MHENDQDYEVAEPAAVGSEDSESQRSRAGRFWRSQPDPVTTADEPDLDDEAVAHDGPVAHDETGLDDTATLDNETGLEAETGLDNETGLEAETGLDNETGLEAETGETRPADETMADDDDVVVVAEVIETEPATTAGDRPGEPFAMPAAADASPSDVDDAARNGMAARTSVPGQRLADESAQQAAAGDVPAAATAQSFGSQEWREIQATFVDDPHGAVQMAASAADSALNALVTGLRERQSSLSAVGSQDTEQLRAALQEYRRFCQSISEIGRQLPEPVAAGS
jgi:hypothetical protein